MNVSKVLYLFNYLLVVHLIISCLASEPSTSYQIPQTIPVIEKEPVRTHANSEYFMIPIPLIDVVYDVMDHVTKIYKSSIPREKKEMIKGIKKIYPLVRDFMKIGDKEPSKCTVRNISKFINRELVHCCELSPENRQNEDLCFSVHSDYWLTIKGNYYDMTKKMLDQIMLGEKTRKGKLEWKKKKYEDWVYPFHKYYVIEVKRDRLDFACMMHNGYTIDQVRSHYKKIRELWDKDMNELWNKWNVYLEKASNELEEEKMKEKSPSGE